MTRLRQVWLPPRPKPDNESAGYLGYYTRVHVEREFDLVDADGSSPAVWYYRKTQSMIRRVYEEKPSHQRQELHPSQNRMLRDLTRWANGGVWVIWNADRLVDAEFPIKLTRLAADPTGDRDFLFESKQRFDEWLLEGLAEPPVMSVGLLDPSADPYSAILHWLRAPYAPADNQPEIDDIASRFADAIRRSGLRGVA